MYARLSNYRREALREYGDGNYYLTLIAGGHHLIDQDPDLGLCWHEVHAWITEWQDHKDYEADHLFPDFQRLLESEGMGPPAPISHEAILAYKPTQTLEPALSALIQRMMHHPWKDLFLSNPISPMLPWHRSLWAGQEPWGRFGINLMGNEFSDWSPGIFVGFLTNPADHLVDWLNPACPDFSVIMDVHAQSFPAYEFLPVYQRMRDELDAAIRTSAPDFEFLDHLATCPEPNRWHPIHIRKPMLELFRGSADCAEQDRLFIGEASRIIRIIAGCQAFWEFRQELKSGMQAGVSVSVPQ